MANDVARGGLAHALSDHPVLDADAVARARVGIPGNVSGREDPGFARLEVLVDENAPFHGEPGISRERVVRAHANPRDDHIRGNVLAVDEP